MKYMLAIFGNREYWESFAPDDFAQMVDGHAKFDKEVRASGEFVSVAGLDFEDLVKTVHVQNGETVVTDGPFLETKEFLASYYIVETETIERAIELAAKLPSASMNGVRVWPLMK